MSEINIIKIDFPNNIRMRPGMYIGGTDTPSVLLREAIDNSIDELYGYEKTNVIFIKTTKDSWNIVADNGRGIPILWDKENKMTKTCLAVTSTHTGSKFDKDDVAIGLNGVGLSATNALSKKFIMLSRVTENNYNKSIKAVEEAWNTKDRTELFYYIEFSEGNKVSEGCMTEIEILTTYGIDFPTGMSTITAFIPDDTIFETTQCVVPKRNLAYVLAILDKIYHRQVTIIVNGKLIQNEFTPYQFEIVKPITAINKRGEKRNATFYINFECDKVMNVSDFSGSVNSLVCDRGIHVDIAKSAYSEALKAAFNLSYQNLLNGIRLNCIVVATEVDFSSQTKERCTKIEDVNLYEFIKALIPEFKKVFKSNDDYFVDHVARLNEYISSLTRISTINKIKNAIGTVGGTTRVRSKVPKSVRDASINERDKAELFIVEGKSASGSILNTRNARTQAVLELRGVPMNSINRDLDEILDNEEMKSLIAAIGIGVNEYHDMKLARYGKIIIAADADSDGGRIASLILGMIAKRMTFLIDKGMVFVLRSPLYIQRKKDDTEEYYYPEDADKLDRSKPYTRLKGLGELNDEQAEVIITNPNTRRLLQITNENMNEALNLLTMTSSRKQLMIDQNIVTDPYNIGIWY
jgi:DNA gyrase subunit B